MTNIKLCAGALLTETQIAETLAISKLTLRRWRCEGSGPPFYKLGAGTKAPVRYDLSEVQAWLTRVETEVA